MQLSFSIGEVCSLIGVGRTKIYEAISAGDLKARKIGRRTIILKEDVESFLKSLPHALLEDLED